MQEQEEVFGNMEGVPFGVVCYAFEKDIAEEISGEEWREAFLSANSAFYECIGSDRDEFEKNGFCLSYVTAWKDRKKIEQLIKTAMLRPEEIVSDIINMIDTEKEFIHIQWNCKCVLSDKKKCTVILSCMNVEHFNKEEVLLKNRLQQSEKERRDLKNIIFESPVGIVSVKGGNELKIETANREFCKMTGHDISDFDTKDITLAQLIYKEDYMLFEDAAEVSRRYKQSGEFEARIITADNRIVWAVFQCQIYYYLSATPFYLVSCWDITERKKLENEMMLANERYQLLEEVSEGSLLDYDVLNKRFKIPEDYRKFMKNKFAEYEDYDKFLEQLHPQDIEKLTKAIQAASHKEMQGCIEYRLKFTEKEKECYRYYKSTYRSITDYDGKICRIIGRNYDISEEKAVTAKLQREVQLDPLTRILNKKASKEAVDLFLKTNPNSTHALFVIDIDDFKKINDTFGHTVGDMVISDIALLIQEQFTENDIVGRVGGDEFIVFAKNVTVAEARQRAKMLCKTVQKKLSGDGAEIIVTLSAGIAIFNQDGDNYNTLFERADHAMYHIKKNGKNHFIFADEMKDDFCEEKNHLEENEFRKNPTTDKEFLNTAFSLLSHARDINGSLNVLLEQIGRKYGMNLVSVFEYNENGQDMLLTNYWSDMGDIYESSVLPITWPRLKRAACGEFVQTTAGWNKKRPDEWKNWSGKGVPISSLAAVKFEYDNGKTGCIDVGSVEEDKKWTSEEMATICELSRVVAVFVTLRNKMREDQQAIHKLKNRDKLTGLYNQEAFRKKLQEIFDADANSAGSVYALAMTDINNFSYVNENFGPQMGDNILKEFAGLIQRKTALAGCRMYSDYFLILCRGETKKEIIQRVKTANEEFVSELQERYPAGRINLSTGICFDAEKKSFDNIFESANLARKYAKEHNILSGVVYNEKMREKRDEQVLIATRFYGAIQRGEFEMFLQPKFQLEDNTIYGAEALARWKPDGEGYLPPNRFIPALENMGYIMDLDFYIFEQLLKYMTRWKEAGKRLFTISSNFSRRHFENGGEAFLRRLDTVMKKYNIPPSLIEIEVTESVAAEDTENLKRCLKPLSDMGYRIAIDDFGTGYSSLNVLYEIPANVIKIDKSFTDKVMMEGRGEFVSQMGQLIRAAKEEIVVEGIETEEQRLFLKNCGFLYGQGYLFDKPVPAEEFERKYL